MIRKLAAIVVLAVTAASASTAAACSCRFDADVERRVLAYLTDASTVVLAEPVEVQETTRSTPLPAQPEVVQTIRWKVKRAWQGPHKEGEYFATAVGMWDLCGLMIRGKAPGEMLLFLRSDEPYRLHACSVRPVGSRQATEEMEVLDQHRGKKVLGDRPRLPETHRSHAFATSSETVSATATDGCTATPSPYS